MIQSKFVLPQGFGMLFSSQIESSTILFHSIQTALFKELCDSNSSLNEENPRLHIESLLQELSDVYVLQLLVSEIKFGNHEHHLFCPSAPSH